MPPPLESLPEARAWYDTWLRQAALPLWSEAGVDPAKGCFYEALNRDGRPHPIRRRSRAQARQIFVFASAATAGYGEALVTVATRGFANMVREYRRPDGLFINSVSPDGQPLDQGVDVYEQAFVLLAMAALHQAAPETADFPSEAVRVLDALEDRRAPGGGFRESGEHAYQANCHMHLFESALAWEEAGVAGWAKLSDELAELAMGRFISAQGVLREFFDAGWRPLTGGEGLIEPGHHFEWAWLLERWGLARGDARARATARALFENGLRGVDAARKVAVNALWDDFSFRDADARLWPQTEHVKAALRLGDEAMALSAAQGLAQYLDAPVTGAWRDKLRADGSFVEEPSPATSFYHLLGAVLELKRCA